MLARKPPFEQTQSSVLNHIVIQFDLANEFKFLLSIKCTH